MYFTKVTPLGLARRLQYESLLLKLSTDQYIAELHSVYMMIVLLCSEVTVWRASCCKRRSATMRLNILLNTQHDALLAFREAAEEHRELDRCH